MREEIASLVFPVIREGIDIKQGLQTFPMNFDFARSHAKLLGLLQAPVPQELRGEFEGDLSAGPYRDRDVGSLANMFLGIRYALACWLDEVFIRDTPWETDWKNNSMEVALFQTRNRYDWFWDNEERATKRATPYSRDTLEVYYLCVLLGFRGRKNDPIDLARWRGTVEEQILQVDGYTPPPGRQPPPEVFPLSGEAKMERWLFALTAVALAFIPVLILFIGNS